jgi:serine/threonine protein kinase
MILFCRLQWRSPEEYLDRDHDEKMDVYSLGNNFFALLTGLEPFWEEGEDWDKVKERVKRGDKAPIDPRYKERSFAESKLVEVIDWCHEFDPQNRPSVFDVVQFLQDAMTELDGSASQKKEVKKNSG